MMELTITLLDDSTHTHCHTYNHIHKKIIISFSSKLLLRAMQLNQYLILIKKSYIPVFKAGSEAEKHDQALNLTTEIHRQTLLR